MDLEPRVLPPAKPAPVPRPMTQGIRFEAVDFAYPDTARTALTGISLTVRPGEVTALVGPNGSGKTTLVKLLCRLYDPSAGAVTLDGADLRSFDVDELRRHMSVIFQDFAQYQMTARENIRMGKSSSRTTTRPSRPPPATPAPTPRSAACATATRRCWASGSRRARS